MISGIQWTLKTVVAAAEAEMNDDGALRDRLLEAEMQRETGEITDEKYAAIEADLLRAIREIKERRDGGSGAFAFNAGQPIDTGEEGRFQIEAEVAGEFHEETAGRSDRSTRSGSDPGVSTTKTPRTPRTPRTTRTVRTSRTIRASRAK